MGTKMARVKLNRKDFDDLKGYLNEQNRCQEAGSLVKRLNLTKDSVPYCDRPLHDYRGYKSETYEAALHPDDNLFTKEGTEEYTILNYVIGRGNTGGVQYFLLEHLMKKLRVTGTSDQSSTPVGDIVVHIQSGPFHRFSIS